MNTLDKRVKEIVLNWLKEENKDNYVQGTLETSYTLDGIFDVGSLVEALTQYHQDMISEVVEKRIGWKGYVVVDPQADNYKYSPVFLDRKEADFWLKGREISGLEVVEVDILLTAPLSNH